MKEIIAPPPDPKTDLDYFNYLCTNKIIEFKDIEYSWWKRIIKKLIK